MPMDGQEHLENDEQHDGEQGKADDQPYTSCQGLPRRQAGGTRLLLLFLHYVRRGAVVRVRVAIGRQTVEKELHGTYLLLHGGYARLTLGDSLAQLARLGVKLLGDGLTDGGVCLGRERIHLLPMMHDAHGVMHDHHVVMGMTIDNRARMPMTGARCQKHDDQQHKNNPSHISCGECDVDLFAGIMLAQQDIIQRLERGRAVQHLPLDLVLPDQQAAIRIVGHVAWVYQDSREAWHLLRGVILPTQPWHLCTIKRNPVGLLRILGRNDIHHHAVAAARDGGHVRHLLPHDAAQRIFRREVAVNILQRVTEVARVARQIQMSDGVKRSSERATHGNLECFHKQKIRFYIMFYSKSISGSANTRSMRCTAMS